MINTSLTSASFCRRQAKLIQGLDYPALPKPVRLWHWWRHHWLLSCILQAAGGACARFRVPSCLPPTESHTGWSIPVCHRHTCSQTQSLWAEPAVHEVWKAFWCWDCWFPGIVLCHMQCVLKCTCGLAHAHIMASCICLQCFMVLHLLAGPICM